MNPCEHVEAVPLTASLSSWAQGSRPQLLDYLTHVMPSQSISFRCVSSPAGSMSRAPRLMRLRPVMAVTSVAAPLLVHRFERLGKTCKENKEAERCRKMHQRHTTTSLPGRTWRSFAAPPRCDTGRGEQSLDQFLKSSKASACLQWSMSRDAP